MSVEAEASFGFTLMNRLATRPPSKAQSTVSPAKTLATFSSAGRTISVDCSRPARTRGGASDSDTVTLRGGLAVKGCGGVEALSETQAKARLAATAIGIGGFMASAPLLEIGYIASPWAVALIAIRRNVSDLSGVS